MEEAQRKLSLAKSQLLIRSPFFGAIVCRRPPFPTDRVPTAGVDARGRLFVNPAFIESLSTGELVFLLAHEAMHIALLHALREGGRNHLVWNIAADAVINVRLKILRIGTPIEGGVSLRGCAGRSAEDVYDFLLEKYAKNRGVPWTYRKTRDPLNGDVDARDASGMSEAQRREAEIESRSLVAEAAAAARMQGGTSPELESLISSVLGRPIPWPIALERFLSACSRQSQSWSRPNRRYRSIAYLPDTSPMPSMGELVVGIDTSGSLTDHDLEVVFGQLNELAAQCRPSIVRILYCDTEVRREDVFTMEDFPIGEARVPGRGGTDMRKIFEYMEREGIEPDAVVIFTDGKTEFPEKTEVPTIWMISSDRAAPAGAGETVRISRF